MKIFILKYTNLNRLLIYVGFFYLFLGLFLLLVLRFQQVEAIFSHSFAYYQKGLTPTKLHPPVREL